RRPGGRAAAPAEPPRRPDDRAGPPRPRHRGVGGAAGPHARRPPGRRRAAPAGLGGEVTMYPNLTPYLVVLVGLALAGTVVISLRHALLRRLALPPIARRRGEAALVVAGSVLGTAIIVGSLVVGDTFNNSIERQATAALGPVDEIVFAPAAQGGGAT